MREEIISKLEEIKTEEDLLLQRIENLIKELTGINSDLKGVKDILSVIVEDARKRQAEILEKIKEEGDNE